MGVRLTKFKIRNGKNMFCFHKYKKINERQQECSKCGAIRTIECPHVFEEKDWWEIQHNGKTKRIKYRYVCKNCGEAKIVEID